MTRKFWVALVAAWLVGFVEAASSYVNQVLTIDGNDYDAPSGDVKELIFKTSHRVKGSSTLKINTGSSYGSKSCGVITVADGVAANIDVVVSATGDMALVVPEKADLRFNNNVTAKGQIFGAVNGRIRFDGNSYFYSDWDFTGAGKIFFNRFTGTKSKCIGNLRWNLCCPVTFVLQKDDAWSLDNLYGEIVFNDADAVLDLSGFNHVFNAVKDGTTCTNGTIRSDAAAKLRFTGVTSNTLDGLLDFSGCFAGALTVQLEGGQTKHKLHGPSTSSGGLRLIGGTKLTMDERAHWDGAYVEVLDGSELIVKTSSAFSPNTLLIVDGANSSRIHSHITLSADVNAKALGFKLGGTLYLEAGTYGSSQSEAEHVLDDWFDGEGVITVGGEDVAATPLPRDAHFSPTASSVATGNSSQWLEYGPPLDNGVMFDTDAGKSVISVEQSLDNLTVSGVDFESSQAKWESYGKPLLFAGESFVATAMRTDGIYPKVASYFKPAYDYPSDLAADLILQPGFKIGFYKTLDGFKSLSVEGGIVSILGVGGSYGFTRYGFALAGGALSFDMEGLTAPSAIFGTDAGTAADPMKGIWYRRGASQVNVTYGSIGSSAALYLPSVQRGESGVLTFVTTQSGATLGDTAKIFVNSLPTRSGAMTVRKSDGNLRFATFDATQGVTAGTETSWKEGSVWGACIDNTATSTGTHDFGRAEGVLWFGGKTSRANVSVGDVTAGDLTLAAAPMSDHWKTPYSGFNTPKWLGALNLYNVTVAFVRSWPADLYVVGSRARHSAELRWSDKLTTFNYPLHLSGWGENTSRAGRGVIRSDIASVVSGGNNNMIRFAKPVELVGETVLAGLVSGLQNATNRTQYVFNGGIYGARSTDHLHMLLGDYTFTRENGYKGRTILEYDARLFLVTNGTFGAGAVLAEGDIGIHDIATVLNVDAPIRANGTVFMENAVVRFKGETKIAKTVFDDKVSLIAENDVELGAIKDDGTHNQMRGGGRDTSVIVDSATNMTLSSVLGDGAGRLSLVKRGSGTLNYQATNATHSGNVRVEGGVVRLVDTSLTNRGDIAYWLDANRPETIVTNADGTVARWESCNGNGVAFTSGFTKDMAAPCYTNLKANGHNVVSFGAAKKANELVANGYYRQRTVFLVLRSTMYAIANTNSFPTPWSEYHKDNGLRANTSKGWENSNAGYCLFNRWGPMNAAQLRVDGVEKSTNPVTYNLNEVQIITLRHGWDQWQEAGRAISEFRPALGTGPAQTSRFFMGDICEVIAFSRLLEEDEICFIENYLGAKWQALAPKEMHPDAPDTLNYTAKLSPNATIDLAGGILDLNGHDVAVGGLSGTGYLVNSQSNDYVATVMVTNGGSFAGTIGGGIRVVRSGEGGSMTFCKEGEGDVCITGGSAEVGLYAGLPSTNGIVYWCDASRTDTITKEGDYVSAWMGRDGDVAKGFSGTLKERTPPKFEAKGFNGKFPSIRFTGDGTGSAACSELTSVFKGVVRTVVLVADVDQLQAKLGSGLWGCLSKSRGMSLASVTAPITLTTGGSYAYTRAEDVLRVNGVTYSPCATVTLPKLACLAFTIDDDLHNNLSEINGQTALGFFGASAAGSMSFALGEILAYDRALTADELKVVESYLMRKWIDNATSYPLTDEELSNAAVFTGNGSLVLGGGANVHATVPLTVSSLTTSDGGAAFTGDLTLTGTLTARVEDHTMPIISVTGNVTVVRGAKASLVGGLDLPRLADKRWYDVLRATGTTSGDFTEKTSDFGGWKWYKFMGEGVGGWRVVYQNGSAVKFL